jgi:hypothetical protein
MDYGEDGLRQRWIMAKTVAKTVKEVDTQENAE